MHMDGTHPDIQLLTAMQQYVRIHTATVGNDINWFVDR